MESDQRILEVFFEIQRGLPRQGPGSDESTRKALSLCVGLPARPTILDIGCGPGMQTLTLAGAIDGQITAVDTSDQYLGELRKRAPASAVERIAIVRADMNKLPFAPATFDLIWSEGAAYLMGFANALAAWKPLLKPGGYLAVSELVWLEADPPREAAEFFGAEYPAMIDVAAIRSTMQNAGYELIGDFALPDLDWWEHYYAPLAAKLPALEEKHRNDPELLRVVRATKREIEIRRRYPDAYGHAFFVGQSRR
jgi:ubiquinone/menaquinone biosynthesis C-methylase UbiE